MISMRMQKFYKRRHFEESAGSKGNSSSRRRDVGHRKKAKANGRRLVNSEDLHALGTLDGEGLLASYSEDEPVRIALPGLRSSGSDTEMSARDKAGLGIIHQEIYRPKGLLIVDVQAHDWKQDLPCDYHDFNVASVALEEIKVT
ncbi:hypothetical protein Tco_0209873 [Tanacetum coccineum]